MTRILLAVAVMMLVTAGLAFAKGDLSRNNPIEIKLEMGTSGAHMYFRPNHLDLETGKAYKLVLVNVDAQKHELDPHEFVELIFTRKVEVLGADGKTIAEIKGAVREIELLPKGSAEWFFVPVQTADSVEMECAIEGHKQAGMTGTITIR